MVVSGRLKLKRHKIPLIRLRPINLKVNDLIWFNTSEFEGASRAIKKCRIQVFLTLDDFLSGIFGISTKAANNLFLASLWKMIITDAVPRLRLGMRCLHSGLNVS